MKWKIVGAVGEVDLVTADPSGLASPDPESVLRPYVPAVASRWLVESPHDKVQIRSGSLAYIDISGFTRLTELLAARGKAGAEEMTGYLDVIFAELIGTAYAHQGELIKWGGDAIFVWYSGDDHAGRAVDAAWHMQKSMARIGRLQTSAGRSTLRMSVGIHSGDFHFFSVGRSHRELLVAGPAATVTAHLEAVAEAGEIVVSASTARQLPARVLGAAKQDGILVTADPRLLKTPNEVPASSLGQPSLSLPDALRGHLVAAPVESEHRQVAVAFIEFCGVDDLLEQAGASAVAGMLDDLVIRIQDACIRHAVTFWETDVGEGGGKVMLVAGAPSSTDDDAGRIMSTVRETLDAEGPLQLRAGINYGRVFAGGFGPPYRRTYSAKGDAVNLAARVMGRAGPGEIYVSDAALRRSRVRFGSEEIEPFLVKGKEAPVHAHRLGTPREGGGSFSPGDSALFGREKEVRVLEDQLAAAIAGHGRCVMLTGAPGLGKSRLIAEAHRAAGERETLMVDCDQYGSLIPYSSLRVLFWQALGLDPDASAQSSAKAVQAAVERVAPHLRPWLPLIATVVGAEVAPTAETSALAERFRRDRLERAVTEFLGLLVPDPALFVIDDAQWMDDASAAFVARLVGDIGSHPWLLVIGRTPDGPGLVVEKTDDVIRLPLEPLDDKALSKLLRSLTGQNPLPPHQRDALSARSGGNPLFLLELFEAGRQAGFDSTLPDTVEGVLAAQIDRLAPADRRLLRSASVLGMQVPLPVLAEMLDDDVGTSRLAGFEEFLTADGVDTLRFRHNILRDAAYEGLSYGRRRELHARAAEVLERRSDADGSEIAALLALHYSQSARHQEAWRHARRAGERAQEAFAPLEAMKFFELALTSGRTLRDVDPADLRAVAEAMGDAQARVGEFASAEATYQAARRWATEPTDRGRLYYKGALATDREGTYPRTLRLLTRAEKELTGTDSAAVTLRAEIKTQYGLVRYQQGRGREARRLLTEAVAIAEEAVAPDVLATALLHLDMAELAGGAAGDGTHAERAVILAGRPGGDPWMEGRARNQLGIRAYFAGRWPEAIRHYTDARAANEKAGDHWSAAIATLNVAEVLSDQGYLSDAEPMLEEALDISLAASTPILTAEASRMLGRLAARAGHPERSFEFLARARAIYATGGQSLQVLLTDALLAEAHLLAGDPPEAGRIAAAVFGEAAERDGGHLVLPLAGRVLAVALRAQEIEADRAWQALAASLEVAREHGVPYEIALSLQTRSDLWPEDSTAPESSERDRLFATLGITESARRITDRYWNPALSSAAGQTATSSPG